MFSMLSSSQWKNDLKKKKAKQNKTNKNKTPPTNAPMHINWKSHCFACIVTLKYSTGTTQKDFHCQKHNHAHTPQKNKIHSYCSSVQSIFY